MWAVTEVAPLSPPMASITRVAQRARRRDPRPQVHATDVPREDERTARQKDPAGMVVAKVPIWSVTGAVRGLSAGAVLLKVKPEPSPPPDPVRRQAEPGCLWKASPLEPMTLMATLADIQATARLA
jgi:hypothetical protein